ncbi:hypothetical protein GIB67_019159 [Kingdonia uniflora]|uniref:Uncharacterized protein n=1 Tax=Kingdonia uniflora TaxID=39325 RepID=A0A7J7N040_9MAGN|nr:hypothetical protein GIB67_019159 [Kingdonia uniflora]
MAKTPPLLHEIGPDGLARESPVIAYTEKIIEAEQLQLKKEMVAGSSNRAFWIGLS